MAYQTLSLATRRSAKLLLEYGSAERLTTVGEALVLLLYEHLECNKAIEDEAWEDLVVVFEGIAAGLQASGDAIFSRPPDDGRGWSGSSNFYMTGVDDRCQADKYSAAAKDLRSATIPEARAEQVRQFFRTNLWRLPPS